MALSRTLPGTETPLLSIAVALMGPPLLKRVVRVLTTAPDDCMLPRV